jgi:uncharacterized membrane protein
MKKFINSFIFNFVVCQMLAVLLVTSAIMLRHWEAVTFVNATDRLYFELSVLFVSIIFSIPSPKARK